jgi:hypothetical protein
MRMVGKQPKKIKNSDRLLFTLEKDIETRDLKLTFFGRKGYTMRTKDDAIMLVEALNREIREW